mmetsp:Transcript_4661/g.13117  ORF Transcript_4661/g.13117 Transcript_4661/m.13117 type:complete len:230 (-) Transcript_4661:703-1392(-)
MGGVCPVRTLIKSLFLFSRVPYRPALLKPESLKILDLIFSYCKYTSTLGSFNTHRIFPHVQSKINFRGLFVLTMPQFLHERPLLRRGRRRGRGASSSPCFASLLRGGQVDETVNVLGDHDTPEALPGDGTPDTNLFLPPPIPPPLSSSFLRNHRRRGRMRQRLIPIPIKLEKMRHAHDVRAKHVPFHRRQLVRVLLLLPQLSHGLHELLLHPSQPESFPTFFVPVGQRL